MYRIDNLFKTIDEAIKFSPDAAIFSNPASMHIQSALPFANTGVNLLIEKPISNNLEQAQDLVALCERKNIKLMTGYNLRYLPSLIEFRKLILGNKIGTIYSIKSEAGSFLPNWRRGKDYRDSVSGQEGLGGGVLLELSHELDYIQWIFGPIKWVSAKLTKQSELEVDVEDTSAMIVGIDKETNLGDLIASINLDFIRRDPIRNCSVVGSKGSLRWDGLEGTIKHFPMNAKNWETLYSKDEDIFTTYKDEIKNFFDSIINDSNPLVDGNEGLKTLQVVEAAKKSSDTGKVVTLDKK